MCRTTPSDPLSCCQKIGPRFGATCARIPVRLAVENVSSVSRCGLQRFTKVSLLVALDGGVVCGIEIVEDNTGMRDLDIGLFNAVSISTSFLSPPQEATHPNMVIQIVSNRKVDPLVR
jgi:hypothetical protein